MIYDLVLHKIVTKENTFRSNVYDAASLNWLSRSQAS